MTGIVMCAMHAAAADGTSELLMRIRQRMAENLARLPNYTCRETIERTAAAAGSHHFTLIDRLRLEVAYVSGRELYAWPGAAKFDDRPIEEIVGDAAAIGSGSFAMHARVVFTTNAPQFTYDGEEQREGRRIVRFRFQVSLEKSRYAIQTGTKPVTVPYRGYFEADAATFAPLTLEVEGVDLPAGLKLRSASEIMRYGQARIGDTDFLLPIGSELVMIAATGHESRNRTSFEQCRQYAGESTVRFDVVDGDSAAGPSAAPIDVPTGVSLEAMLRDRIAYATAARGDPVYAVVSGDVKRGGHVIVPKGAVVVGRITRVMSYSVRSSVYFTIGVRFHAIEFGARSGEFSAVVDSAGVGTNYFVRNGQEAGESFVSVKATLERFDAGTRLLLRRK
jgi:hypothetical protein